MMQCHCRPVRPGIHTPEIAILLSFGLLLMTAPNVDGRVGPPSPDPFVFEDGGGDEWPDRPGHAGAAVTCRAGTSSAAPGDAGETSAMTSTPAFAESRQAEMVPSSIAIPSILLRWLSIQKACVP